MKIQFLKRRAVYWLAMVVFVVGACNKKEDDYLFTAGKDRKMEVTEHNQEVEVKFIADLLQADSLALDLDNDGQNDIIGISMIDDGPLFTDNYYQELSIAIINKQFVFSEVENSGVKSQIFIGIEYSYDGTFPRKTSIYSIVCKEENSSNFMTSNSPKYLLEDSDLNESDFVIALNTNSKINLKVPDYTPRPNYQPSVGGDSLIGARFDFGALCEAVPEQTEVYLPFLKQVGPDKRYGYLKVQITGNRVLFIESAIQKD